MSWSGAGCRQIPLRSRVAHNLGADLEDATGPGATAFQWLYLHRGQLMITPPRQPDTLIAKAMLAAAIEQGAQPATADELAALERLIAHAQRDSGQSRIVADFLLAWWNAGSCGGFDLTSVWALDSAIVADMTVVFGLIGRVNHYPDRMGYEAEFTNLVRTWRPELDR